MKKFIIPALAIVAMVSCSEEATNFTGDKVAVNFTEASITRASGNEWEDNDQIGVYQVPTGVALSDEVTIDGYCNVPHAVDAAGTVGVFTAYVSGTELYFPIDGSAVDHYAYYPYTESVTGAVYKVDVTDQSTPNSFDLMRTVVTGNDKNNTTATFVFTHELTMMTLNLSVGDGLTEADLANLKVEVIGQYNTADYDLATGVFTPTGEVANITALTTADGLTTSALLLPTESVSADSQISFTLDATGEIFYWSFADRDLTAGVNAVYDIKLTRTGVDFIGSEITNWDSQDKGEGTAD